VLPDPEADVEPDRESNADNLEGEDEDETVAQDTGTILKKASTKVHFVEGYQATSSTPYGRERSGESNSIKAKSRK
jgi:hypothetical protein